MKTLFLLLLIAFTAIAVCGQSPSMPPMKRLPPHNPVMMPPPRPMTRTSMPRPKPNMSPMTRASERNPTIKRSRLKLAPNSAAAAYNMATFYSIRDIRAGQPVLSDTMIFQDVKAIKAATPAVSYIFQQKGLSEEDAKLATLAGWRHLRLGTLPPTAMLSPKDLINLVTPYGKVVISSVPDDAEVIVDDKILSPKMKTAYCTPGPHRVRINKAGYLPVDDSVEIIENDVVIYHSDLKKQ